MKSGTVYASPRQRHRVKRQRNLTLTSAPAVSSRTDLSQLLQCITCFLNKFRPFCLIANRLGDIFKKKTVKVSGIRPLRGIKLMTEFDF